MSEWKTVRLGDYITEYSVKNKSNEDIPVYSVTNTQGFCTEYFSKDVSSKDKSNYKIVPRGCFAYNPSRINVGSVDWQRYEDRVIVSPLYNVFKVSPELENQYLYYFLKSDIGHTLITSKAEGSVRDNLKITMLAEFSIPLPPLEEQKHIAAMLDKCTALVTKHKLMLEKYDTLIKSRFIEIFGTDKDFSKWNCCCVEDVADVTVGVVIKPTQYYCEKGIPAFRSLNIGEMKVNDSDWVYFTEEGNKKNKKSILKENDVLVVRSGAPGKSCVITKKYEGYNVVDAIIAHPNLEKVNPVFLCMFTNMPHGMNQIKAKTGGAAQQHFNVGGYNALKMILPPLSLQNDFAAFVQQIDKSKFAVQKSLEKAETLYKSLMQQYFA